MRKSIVIFGLILCAGFTAAAQGAGEALLFGENTYYGTARSAGLGNAVTALGGDLGSIGINPAGSAVNSWSQFTITPALTIFSGTSRFNGANPDHNTRGRLNMPNIGAVVTMDTHRTSGLKAVSFGFVSNTTDIYNSSISTSGRNNQNSYMGFLADYATRYQISSAALNDKNLSNLDYYTDWPAAIGYQTGVVNPATGVDGAPYISPVQDNTTPGYPMRGDIDQEYSFKERGSKQDILINLGFNFSDRFMIGGNIGLLEFSYTRDVTLREVAVNPADFPCSVSNGDGTSSAARFEDMRYSHQYCADGSGIYAKLGIIAIPFDGLRIGASVQTRTAGQIREVRWYQGSSNFTDGSKSHSHGGDRSSEYEYKYDLSMPARYSFGLAYTIPGVGLLSADYELSDYGTSRYREHYYADDSAFNESNKQVSDYLGIAHYIRAGLEVRLASLALRAGYNLAISPLLSFTPFDGTIMGASDKVYTNTFSGGIGYDSGSSFFMDFALRARINPEKFQYLYPTADSPEISTVSSLWNALVTFGFRF